MRETSQGRETRLRPVTVLLRGAGSTMPISPEVTQLQSGGKHSLVHPTLLISLFTFSRFYKTGPEAQPADSHWDW